MSTAETHESLLIPEIYGGQAGGVVAAGVNEVRGSVVVDSKIVTWTLEVPDGLLAYDGVAHFMHGYGGIKVTSKPPSHAFAERGVATLRSRPARGGLDNWWESVTNPQEIHARAQQAIAADLRTDATRRKLGRIPNGLDLDVDKKVLLLHSMAGLGGARYAELETGAVDMMINLMAVGYGSPTMALLAENLPKGLYGSLKHELIPGVRQGDIPLNLKTLQAMAQYYSKVRALFEARSCLREDIRPRVAKLRDKGIAVGYLAARYDILVPPQADVPFHVDHHKILSNAGHLAPQIKSGLVADESIEMLKAHQTN